MFTARFTQSTFLVAMFSVCVFLVGCPPPTPTGPTAEFTADVTSGEAALEVQFTDHSAAGSSPITAWLWDFGDSSQGAERTSQNPLHTYQTAGDYSVTLTVTTVAGSDTATQTHYIHVVDHVPPPTVDVEMVSVAAGSFVMGRTDEEWWGREDELPRHSVTLDAYEIGVREVTAGDFAAMLNWALAQGYLIDENNEPYTQLDNVCVADPNHWSGRRKIFQMDYVSQENDLCPLEFTGGQFSAKERDGIDMSDHPILQVTWCGAVMYCNWINDIQGLPRCYDENWQRIDPLPDGYRLPTEAEWERAAAWDGHHWRYGFQRDEIDGTWCNYANLNPLELTKPPYTVPVAYFPATSPVGCVGMSGNVHEWCHDGYEAYPETPQVNPTGRVAADISTTSRVYRGGDWFNGADAARTAARFAGSPTSWGSGLGFRLARTP